MTQREKLKRWAEKQGWFAVNGNETYVSYLLPNGVQVWVAFSYEGTIVDTGKVDE